MLDNLLSTGEQVLVLIVLLAVGFLCGKINIFNAESISHLSAFALKIVGPCAIIQSFCRPFDMTMFHSMGIVIALSAICHFVYIFFATVCIHNQDLSVQRVQRYSVVFANCGYMGLPLQQLLFGADGVFLGASWIIVYQLFTWTYGLVAMSGNKREVSLRKILSCPGIIAIAVGLLIFLFSWTLPQVIGSPIEYLSQLNVPIPMVISGYFLSKADLKAIWKHGSYYLPIALRLFILPLVCMGILYGIGTILPLKSSLLTCCIIDVAAPVAAATTMFSTLYKQDSETAANLVSVSTLLSVLTLPVIVVLAQGCFSLLR